jgi:hypothetical protein
LIEKLKEKYSRNSWVSIVAAVTDKRPRNRGPIPNKSNRIFLYLMAPSCFSGPQSLLPVTPGTRELFLRCTSDRRLMLTTCFHFVRDHECAKLHFHSANLTQIFAFLSLQRIFTSRMNKLQQEKTRNFSSDGLTV